MHNKVNDNRKEMKRMAKREKIGEERWWQRQKKNDEGT